MGFSIPVAALNSSRGISNPLGLSGCICWLRSDLGVTLSGSNVVTWANQAPGSSANAIAPSPFINATGPLVGAGGLNGRNYLSFNGTSHAFTWNLSYVGAQTIAFIFRSTDETAASVSGISFYTMFGTSSGVNYTSELTELNFSGYTIVNLIAVQPIFSFAPITVGYGSGIPFFGSAGHSLISTYNNTGNASPSNYNIFDNSASRSLTTSGAYDRTATSVGSIGARYDSSAGASAFFTGELYEIIVYNRVLSGPEQSMLNTYISHLYAL